MARVICFILLFCAFQSSGGDIPMLHYTINEGLPSNTVYYTYRDSKGFLWVATDKGLARYNGIRFEVFTTGDGMPDNEIFSLQEDATGRLWLATYNGKLCYFRNGKFYSARNTPFLALPFKNTLVKKILLEQDSSVTILFENRQKLVNISREHRTVLEFHNDTDLNNLIIINKIASDKYRMVFTDHISIVDTNLHELDRKPFSWSNTGEPVEFWEISNAQNQRYVYNNRALFTTRLSLIRYFTAPISKTVRSVYLDNENNIFKGTDDGLLINDTIQLLAGNKISPVTQDVQHNYWIGTLKDGVYVMNSNYLHSNQYVNAYSGSIWYASADNGNVFFTNSDNNFYHLKGNTVRCVLQYEKYRRVEYGNNHGFLVTKDATSGRYDYFNFYNNYIFSIRDITGRAAISQSNHPFEEGEIVKSVIDLDDKVYIRTIKRVFSIRNDHFDDPVTLNVKNILVADNTDRIYAFAKSPDKQIWFSTINGVYKIINSQDSIQKQFKDITFNKFEFFGPFLIGYTLEGNLPLVCSNLNGTLKVDTIKQDCIWDKFYKIDNEHLLISTTNDYYRLFTLTPNKQKKYSITAVENPFIPIRTESVCCDNANCYFFSNGSIYNFSKENLFQRATPPTLYYNFFNYGNLRYPVYKEVKVPFHNNKNITITFSTLSVSSKTVFYEYSVSKDADNWMTLNGEEINIADPGWGKYTIKVRARTISSAFSSPIEFELEIFPPFWATWWFNTFCILIATTLVVIGVRYRILWVVKKNQKDHDTKIRFLKSEYKALNALMNPHFIFNTLNNVQGLVNRNDKLAANEYLRIFADLVRQNMHNVSKEMISLQKEIDLVANYLALEKLRFKELMNYSINVDDDVDTLDIMVPPLFIQPLVENSIKHGILPRQSIDSKIELNVHETGDLLTIEVRDNGVGFSKAKEKANKSHVSFGLENIRNRVEQLSMILGKKIEFSMEERMEETGQWTVVSIKMHL